MGLFDGVTANLFRQDRAGRRVYAPWGKWGGVYVVPNDAVAARITRTWRRFYQVMLGAILVGGIVLQWHWQIWLIVPIAVLLSIILAQSLTRGLERSTEGNAALQPLTRSEALSRYATAVGRPLLWTMLGGSALFVLAGVWMITSGAAGGWFVVGFFGLCLVSFVAQLRRAR